MKKFENFCAALKNMKEIFAYDEPYGTVVLTGLVGLYEICFELSWKAMKEIPQLQQQASLSPPFSCQKFPCAAENRAQSANLIHRREPFDFVSERQFHFLLFLRPFPEYPKIRLNRLK